MTTDLHAKGPVGKTERLLPLLRETFGRDMALYADANGYYEVHEAIRVGKLLEENKYAYFGEPVMYDDFEAIKQVADALDIPIANGEQDQGFVNFAGSSPMTASKLCSRTATTSAASSGP